VTKTEENVFKVCTLREEDGSVTATMHLDAKDELRFA
jgi:hypothetical protein